jgi:alpha-tubulin suppressor-like RCC1 family protein
MLARPGRPARRGAKRTAALALVSLVALIPMIAAVAPVAPAGLVAPARAATAVDPMIATGIEHTCALMTDGTVRCWGSNQSGQLGTGQSSADLASAANPVAVVGLSDVTVTSLALGVAHTCALIDDGTVRCWGDGGSGRLGNNSTANSPTPVAVSGISTATAITAGNDYTCALLTDETVACWGNNSLGQLGDGTTTNRQTPVPVTGLTGVTAISAGGSHTCAIVTDGQVRCWGNNAFGQLGDGTTTSSSITVLAMVNHSSPLAGATRLSAGGSHTCAILRDPDDDFVCWGRNLEGQLGDGSTTSSSTPVPAGDPTMTVPVAVSAGTEHTCDLLGTRTVRCWGNGNSGRLGDGTTTNRSSPVAVSGLSDVLVISAGNSHTCALRTDDTVRCWGNGSSGRLGDGETTNRTTPVSVLASGTASTSPVPFSVRVAAVVETPVAPVPAVTVGCTPAAGAITVGTEVTCTVTGGDPGSEILWRAAINPVIAEAGVTLDADGTGTFAFTVPSSALGAALTVELVEWTAPVTLGVVGAGALVPTRMPAGEGPWPGGEALALVGLLAVAGMLGASRMRRAGIAG